jgi:hypothetical protein
MLLPNRVLWSNLVNLVCLMLPIWNPIALSLSSRLGSICFFSIGYMSKRKNVKLAFYAMVANCCGNVVILNAATHLVIG